MFPINQFEIKKVSENETEGVFEFGPLPKGYGHTLGNTFRRLLLSSIPGAAVTAVKMRGVDHEYSTIAGIGDDVLAIVLAIKGIHVISHSDDPVVLKLEKKGQKSGPVEVTAADLEKNPMVEIINPDHIITTLTDEKSDVDLEVTIEKGLGYAMPDESRRKELGVIPVDANFTPVELVSLDVKDTRVGQQTDLDMLRLTIITTGAIAPSAAVFHAAEILVEVSSHLKQTAGDLLTKKAAAQIEEAELPMSQIEESVDEERPSLRVVDLDLPTRLTNALLNNGYEDLHDLDGLTVEEVRDLKGMGDKSFDKLLDVLKEHNIRLI